MYVCKRDREWPSCNGTRNIRISHARNIISIIKVTKFSMWLADALETQK